MKFISLFTGIGGLDLGLERAGMECIAQVEIDDYCQRVLQKHWPNVPKFKDVRDVGKHNLPKADAIVGGFPCQPHSTTGKRKGAADDRNLWPEYFRIIDELRPNWVLGENVLGIRTTILDQVLSDLESLEYTTVTLDIPAAGFNAPHIRERLFIIAHAKSGKRDLSVPTRKQKEELYTGRFSKDGDATHASGQGLSKRQTQAVTSLRSTERTGLVDGREANYWVTQSGVCGVCDGVPNRVDRIRALGNAVVPQVAEFIGRSLIEIDRQFE